MVPKLNPQISAEANKRWSDVTVGAVSGAVGNLVKSALEGKVTSFSSAVKAVAIGAVAGGTVALTKNALSN